MKKGTSIFENGLIWFGAAVSVAEIITGTYFAPLGFEKGLLAIIIGHIIGIVLLFLAGLIGGTTKKSSMETVKMSFGSRGALFFSLLNIIQLVGWTAIMIYDGAIALDGIVNISNWIWCAIIGALILAWILIGIKNLAKLNIIAVALLFVLTIMLCFAIFRCGNAENVLLESITFGAAVELSVAMPLSWLPLISDYTKDAEKPIKATAVSAGVYGIVSSWMYVIGMSSAIFTGESDISCIMLKAGLGIAGLMIIILSTVTTTFLDAYSSGVSAEAISKKISAKWVAVVVTVAGTAGAVFLPLANITDFLYFIGSVFAPMIAIQIADFYILKKKMTVAFDIKNMVIWLIGFIAYRWLMNFDFIVGCTLVDVVLTVILCVLLHPIKKAE